MTGLIFGLAITLFFGSFVATAFCLAYGYFAMLLLLAVIGSFFGVVSWKIVKNDDKKQCQ